MKKIWIIISLVSAIVVIACILLGIYFFIISQKDTGFIEGEVSYPSEGVPGDLKVYAENIDTKKTYATTYKAADGNRFNLIPRIAHDDLYYKIEVPAGRYYVYAKTNYAYGGKPFPRDYRAYYTEFVKYSGYKSKEPHKPVIIKVKSGETVSNVDPSDWIKQYTLFPIF